MFPLCAILLATLLIATPSGQNPKDLYNRAVELEGAGNHAAALPLLWEAAGLAPRDADIQNRLGEALDRLGALEAAIDAFRRAAAARPGFRKAENNLILTLVKAGRGPEAVGRARALVASAPDDPDGYFTLGLAQSEQDVNEAMKSFSRVLELAPRHTLARYNLALVLKRADRADDAIAELRRAIDDDPKPQAYYTLGVVYWQQGSLDRAVSALEAAIAADARYVDAHYTLGAVLFAQRLWSAAERALRRAIALKPDLQGAHYTLGRVLQSAGDAEGARAQFAEAERLRRRAQLEQEASVWTSVGTARLEEGQPAAARDCFRKAIEMLDTYAPAHYQLGRALERLGDRAGADTAFRRAQQLNPSLVPPRH